MAFSLSRLSKRLGKKIEGVSRESMENLLNYPWPGNIRELQNVIERAVIVSADPILRLDRDLIPSDWTRRPLENHGAPAVRVDAIAHDTARTSDTERG